MTTSIDSNTQEPSIVYLDLGKPDTIVSAAHSLVKRPTDDTHDCGLDILINCGGISQRGSVLVCGDQINTEKYIF